MGNLWRWLRVDFAEWLVGSWALLIGWGIVAVIFTNFLVMDGHFSRTLGEGSGIDPALFQHIGWMFRFFAATFLILCVRFEQAGMLEASRIYRTIGAFCTALVIAHAMGFGLTALEGKRVNATAVVETQATAEQSTAQIKVQLESQKAEIRADLAERIAPLNAEITRLDTDGVINEELATVQKERRAKLEDAAQAKIDAIDAQIVQLVTAGGEQRTQAVGETAKAQKWSPLFVGLAQLFTWNPNPSDWAIYICGVLFLGAWVLIGDSIVIFGPPELYKLHLKDKTAGHREKAKAYDDWKAKQSEAGKKGAKRKQRNEKVKAARLAIADMSEKVNRETTPLDEDADDEPEAEIEPEAPDALSETDADLSADNDTEDEPRPDIKAAE